MRPLVVDASALVEYLFSTASRDSIAPLLESAGMLLNVPELCDLEVLAACRRGVLQRRFTVTDARQRLAAYLDLPIERHTHATLLTRALDLHPNFSAYDAAYVALAEALDAELLTADAALARAIVKHTRVPLARP